MEALHLRLGRVALLGDGAATLVPWSEAERRPILSGEEFERLEAHMRAEAERFRRKMDRLAGTGQHYRNDEHFRGGHRGGKRPPDRPGARNREASHTGEVKRPFTIEARYGRRSTASKTPLLQSFIDGPQPF